MKNKLHITIIVLFFSTVSFFAQTNTTSKADSFFARMSYVKASVMYAKLAKRGATQHILQRLGDSYYYNVKMHQASLAYSRLFNKYSTKVPLEYMFKYAQSLRGEGKYESSDFWMNKFHKLKQEDKRGFSFSKNQSRSSNLRKSPNYKVTNLKSINTPQSEFGVSFYNGSILFSSARRARRIIKRLYGWNNQPFLDIYKSKKTSTGSLGVAVPFSKEINSKYHESSVSFTSDKQTMYFTRNNYNNGEYRKDKRGINNLKIYRAEKNKSGKWDNIKELPFNSDEYSTGHPSVNKDGTRLYFTSDMPGTIGQTDIFYVEIQGKNKYGVPVNLGNTINTEGREMFPFISEDNTLYFSSDGHFGLGSLDIFSSNFSKKGFELPKNLKFPINSELDDFSFIINPNTKKGYLSSNRKGGLGDDDIYSFTQIKEVAPRLIVEDLCMQKVIGTILDKKLQKPLIGSRIVLMNQKGDIIRDTIVDKLGKFSFVLPCNNKYIIKASKEYYKDSQESFKTTDSIKVNLYLDFNLEILDEFSYNTNKELIVKINPIYFDYNKSDIRLDAAIELDHIVSVMKKYPQIKIQSGSHTDARGKSFYNERLSDRRAQSTVRYIISKGISLSRITGKGYGETQLTNDCVDNDRHTNRVNCSKTEHQVNRRTEFIILKTNN